MMKAGQRVRIGERDMAFREGRASFMPHARCTTRMPTMYAMSPTLSTCYRLGWNAARADWVHAGRPVQLELKL